MMNKSSIWLVAGVLLLSLSGLAANAQSFYFTPRFGMHLGDNDWGFRQPGHVIGIRQAEFNERVAHLRREIGFNMDRGIISREKAALLNGRLDDIAAREGYMAAGGMLNGDELARLEARLNNVEYAARESSYY
jgi:hypothetical protein